MKIATEDPKSVYTTPRFERYGDVRELTKSIGNHGGKDGKAVTINRTQA